MNNLISFWLAPVTAFFHPQVYRDAAKGKAGRGVLYVLYLSVVATALLMTFLIGRLTAVTDAFADWAQKNTPELIWTPDGISFANGQQTAKLVHPSYGTIAIFDLTKTAVTEADMGDAPVFITATRAFIKKGPGLIDERDFTRTGIKSQQQLPAKVRINGALVKALYANVKRTLMVVLPFLIVPFLFVVQLVGSLVYSLLGLLLNLFRKNKLSYGAIFGLTCFATSTGLMLVWFKAMLPFSQTPLPFLVHVLTNVIYMIVAFKVTDQEPAKA